MEQTPPQQQAAPDDPNDPTYRKVFIGGLPWATTTESLRLHFSQYGEISEAVVILDRQTGRSKGYGFVTFTTQDAANRATADPNPVIDGRRANANLAYLGAKRRAEGGGQEMRNPGYSGGTSNQQYNNSGYGAYAGQYGYQQGAWQQYPQAYGQYQQYAQAGQYPVTAGQYGDYTQARGYAAQAYPQQYGQQEAAGWQQYQQGAAQQAQVYNQQQAQYQDPNQQQQQSQ